MSLYDKITALDLQTSVDIFAYIYCGYQDGCYLHTVMGERPISEDELEQLEYYCKNKAVSAKQIRPNAFKGVILPMIDFPKWNVEEG